MIARIGDFLLSEWLWSMTFASSYFVIHFFIMWWLLYRYQILSFMYSCLLTFAVIATSFLIYSGIVIGFFIYCLQWWYVPDEYPVLKGPFLANMYLACIGATIQSFLFYLLHRLFGLVNNRLLLITYVSNGLAAYFSYLYITVVFKACL